MTKKDNLKLVFDFIAEYLSDDNETKVADPAPIQEPVKTSAELKAEITAKEKQDKLSKLEALIKPEEVRHLMQRVDEMDRTPSTSPLLGNDQRNFEAEFKNMVKQVDELTKEKKQNELDDELNAIAKSDYQIINTLRSRITGEEIQKVKSERNGQFMNSFVSRTNENISFSG